MLCAWTGCFSGFHALKLAARIMAGIHPNGERLYFSPVLLTPLEATFLLLLIFSSFPFPSLIPITL